MIDETISHYRILEKLGEGGMGVVYKARDTKLRRLVALKFLPPEFTREADAKQRLIHEAQAASALLHDNICTIHEIDESENGQLFICMDYYEGETLRQKIERGSLKVDEATSVALHIAEGLSRAHEKGVVHRDIKPANVLITKDKTVKLLDFGLAKLRGRTQLTREGTTLGTVAYMSPEQTQGKEVDHTTDIWALGVLLYEMLTGRQPFEGDYDQAVIYSILNEEPTPMHELRPDVPTELERLVNTCLRKQPSERYQGMTELILQLRQVKQGLTLHRGRVKRPLRQLRGRFLALTGIVLTAVILTLVVYLFFTSNKSDHIQQRKMVAVLPFTNLGEAEDEYFADGITNEITARLAGISGLGVIARESAFKYKGSELDIQEIGKELRVQYVLSGTIRWQRSSAGGSRVKVTPTLINVADNTHVWANIYDEVLAEVFEVQSDIAENVTKNLNVVVLEPERQALKEKPTENLEAYNYYLRGRETFQSLAMEGYKRRTLSEQMLQKAVELDSNFALAYAWLGMVHSNIYFWNQDRSAERLAKSREAIDKALKLNPGLPDTHNALGLNLYRYPRDYERAIEEFETALKLKPDDAFALRFIADVKKRQAKFEQAIEYYHKAAFLNPNASDIQREVGVIYSYTRRFDEAEQAFERMISLWPDVADGYFWLARTYLVWQGNREKAIKIHEMALEKLDSRFEKNILLVIATTKGEYNNALQYLERINAHFYYLEKARLYDFLGHETQRVLFADSARSFLETRLQTDLDIATKAWYHYDLGYANALLGRKEEALRITKKADDLWPLSKEPYWGVWWRENWPKIYVLVGEYDLAIDQLEHLLSIPSGMTVARLRIEPEWEPLRDHPRFRRLLNQAN